ncbi:hypothetical protein BGX31_004542 [Mortierella sp. GBA43]|nr:hypothetical protein BGX31_004542 [Mortierella sp. GBA43]
MAVRPNTTSSTSSPKSNISEDIAAEERTSKALLRLSEFSRAFDCSLEHQTLQFWRTFVDQFFETNGRLRLKLSNPATLENKVFELRTPSIPVYYLGSVEAGIKNQQLILEQALVQTKPLPLSVECPSVTLASHYTNGAKVFTSGAMKAIFTDDFKFTLLELTSLNFTEYIARPLEGLPVSMLPEPKFEGRKKNDLKRSMTSQHNPSGTPESIVNGFGITLKAMRLLEVSDTCSKMGDLIQWSVRCKASSADSGSTVIQ